MMEAVMLHDQSISSYNPRRNRTSRVNGFAHRRISGNIAHGSLLNIHGSLFGVPPSLSSSFSSFSPSLSSSSAVASFYSFSSFNLQQQPPLLPLPSTTPPTKTTNRKIYKTNRDLVVEPKKAKTISDHNSKKESSRSTIKDCSTVVSSTDRLGPDPCDLPKEVPKFIKSSSLKVSSAEGFEMFSGSIFSLSPPPSSLPLPKFSVRPKRRCNAEAGGVDTGATDDLRRLLRLQ